mmetsp:Transcript_22728/g.40882  ORF Transcript_22728/g.40882 Transcript_22728/m.40882 type:complete len:356 (-) Transcript_22728:32-1099(-)
MDYDPFGFKRYGKFFRPLWVAMLAVPVCMVLSLVFFLIVISSSRDSELSSVNSAVYAWNYGKTAKDIASYSFMTKVMPSQGHGVYEQMKWTNEEDPEYKVHLDSDLRGALTDYDISYHILATNTSFEFPVLTINDDMVPVGMSELKCIYISWAPAKNANHTHEYQDVSGLPDCARASMGLWSEHDPAIGVDFYVWKQSTIEVSCSKSSCVKACESAGGWWSFDKDREYGNCYTYEVLDSLCLTVEKSTDIYGKISWTYKGGCFHDDSIARYHHGEPGSTYQFENVKIQLRSVNDPYIAAVKATDDDLEFSRSTSILEGLAWVFFIGFIASLSGLGVTLNWLKKHPQAYEEQRDIE